MSNSEIATSFSNGDFSKVYDHLAEKVQWVVVGENTFTGKEAVVQQCEKVAAYFKTVTTNFTTHNIIADQDHVAIDGSAEFVKDGQRISFVESCDVYEFDDDKKLEKITSYCIQQKK